MKHHLLSAALLAISLTACDNLPTSYADFAGEYHAVSLSGDPLPARLWQFRTAAGNDSIAYLDGGTFSTRGSGVGATLVLDYFVEVRNVSTGAVIHGFVESDTMAIIDLRNGEAGDWFEWAFESAVVRAESSAPHRVRGFLEAGEVTFERSR